MSDNYDFFVQIAVLVLIAVGFSNAEDDGQYRPERYGGDDGSYRPGFDGRYYDNSYKSLIASNGKYDSIYTAYQPVYYKEYDPYQQLLTPFVNYGAESR